MFGFLSGIQAKFIAAVILVLVLLAAWFYVKHLESSLDAAQSKLARMEDVVTSQKLAIDNLNKDIIRMNEITTEYSSKVDKIEQDTMRSVRTLSETKTGKSRDFNKIINKHPDLVEKAINQGTKDALRCNELATGAPLTPGERAGIIKNKVCPELLGVKK